MLWFNYVKKCIAKCFVTTQSVKLHVINRGHLINEGEMCWKSAFASVKLVGRSERCYSIITHVHIFHGDLNRAYGIFLEMKRSRLRSDGANKRKGTVAKDIRCEKWAPGSEVAGEFAFRRDQRYQKDSSPSPSLLAATSARRRRLQKDTTERNAPLTSDAPNAIRTTLSRNISQIGVECLATSNFVRSERTRPSVRGDTPGSHSRLLRARISK